MWARTAQDCASGAAFLRGVHGFPGARGGYPLRRVKVYKGETVSGGIALGKVYLQGYEEGGSYEFCIASDEVEDELNRLREAFSRSRKQVEDIRAKQEGHLSPSQLQIFDVHLTCLQDPLFVDEIEKLVIEERLRARSAITRVARNYDRIFALVENDNLRQRAGDLRDVATRLLRNLDDEVAPASSQTPPPGRYVLAARKLNTADMFDLENEKVEGIVVEEGGISSHAAILARSMGIPTISGIRDLPGKLENGRMVVLDGNAGEVIFDPDESLLGEYEEAARQFRESFERGPATRVEHATRDGTEVRILGSAGSPGEADLARTYGMDGIGLFRTELLFLIDERLPEEDRLVEQYEQVVRRLRGQPVNFRLLDVSTGARVAAVDVTPERNPAMGVRGIRLLLQHPDVLRLQLRAILRAAAGTEDTGVLVPFVTGVSDLQRVKAAILEERQALRKRGVPAADQLSVAPIVEVPAAAFVLHAFLNECDFAVVAIDDLQAHLLAADRDNAQVRDYYSMLHPALFELLARMARDAERREKRLIFFGEGAADPARVPFYVGVGIRDLSVAPVRLKDVLGVLRRFTVDECRKIAERILEAPRSIEVQRVLVRLTGD